MRIGFGNSVSNFLRTSKAKRVNLKSLLSSSTFYCNTLFKVKEKFKHLLAIKVKKTWR